MFIEQNIALQLNSSCWYPTPRAILASQSQMISKAPLITYLAQLIMKQNLATINQLTATLINHRSWASWMFGNTYVQTKRPLDISQWILMHIMSWQFWLFLVSSCLDWHQSHGKLSMANPTPTRSATKPWLTYVSATLGRSQLWGRDVRTYVLNIF